MPERHARALRAAGGADGPDALYAALEGAFAGHALTDRFRDREAARRARLREGGALEVEEVIAERATLLSAAGPEATLELQWRLRGSVTHAGHTHPRHLRATSRVTARHTDAGWRIVDDQPVEVLAMP